MRPRPVSSLLLASTTLVLVVVACTAWTTRALVERPQAWGAAARSAVDSTDGAVAAAELLVDAAIERAKATDAYEDLVGSLPFRDGIEARLRSELVSRASPRLRSDSALAAIARATEDSHEAALEAARLGESFVVELDAAWEAVEEQLEEVGVTLPRPEVELSIEPELPWWARALAAVDLDLVTWGAAIGAAACWLVALWQARGAAAWVRGLVGSAPALGSLLVGWALRRGMAEQGGDGAADLLRERMYAELAGGAWDSFLPILVALVATSTIALLVLLLGSRRSRVDGGAQP